MFQIMHEDKLHDMQIDCLNANFSKNLIVELYTQEDATSDKLSFYKMFLESEKFEKVIDIPATGDHFCHSFAKIHRNSTLTESHTDALMVFKVIRCPSKLF